MKTGLSSLFRRALKKAPPIHPLEGKMAKMWIKRRLMTLFPELRNNPAALEEAYQSLNLEPKRGVNPGDPLTYFEMSFPE